MSSPSLENSPRIQNIHAQVPKRKNTNSAHTLRPNTSQTNGSGNASWDKGQGKTLENQAGKSNPNIILQGAICNEKLLLSASLARYNFKALSINQVTQNLVCIGANSHANRHIS